MQSDRASFGRYPAVRQRHIEIPWHDAPLPGLGPLLPRGLGSSYGDVCLNDGGTVLDTRWLDHFVAFDAVAGTLTAEAGVTVAEVNRLTWPRGWTLPVTPGTQQVSLGGAVANDVHGKNHLRAGSFGCHVRQLWLTRSDRGAITCAPDREPALFAATVGGLGVTGLITRVAVQLQPLSSMWLAEEAIPFAGFDEFQQINAASRHAFEFTAAWVDSTHRGGARGIYFRAHVIAGDRPPTTGRRMSVPVVPPVGFVNAATVRMFNLLYQRVFAWRARGASNGGRRRHRASVLYPLDAIADWNRLYGPRGFVQHQCVVPLAAADAIPRLLDAIARARQGSMLTVLKELGPRDSGGLLSFPRCGLTLAMDFPFRGAATLELLQRLDAIVVEAGGRIYPAKDACMSPATFRAGYPRLAEFLQHVDPAMSSSFLRRVGALR